MLALVLALAPQVLLPVQAAEYKGSCGDSVNWTLNTETGLMTISGEGAMKDYDYYNTVMPWMSNRSYVTDLVIEPGVTSVGSWTFAGFKNLTNVSLSTGLESIGSNAFTETGLTELSIPDSVTVIGDYAFSGCSSLAKLELGEGVSSIGKSAFIGCYELPAVSIPDSVTSIGSFAFDRCYALTDVKLPKNLTAIEEYAFGECTSLVRIVIPDGVKSIGNAAFLSTKITNLVLPEGLETIESGTFKGSSLVEIRIPASVTKIGNDAFYGCSDLQRIAVLNPSCTLPSNSSCFGVVGTATVYGYKDSTAHTVAMNKGYSFEVITDSNLWEDENNEPIFNQAPIVVDNPFTDVAEGRFYYNPVLWAVDKGITSGMTPTTFQPDSTCTRGQVVTFLWRTEDKPNPGSSNPFVDVKQGAFYYNAVLWAAANGVTAGMDATHFGTEQGCTRGQVVTFLYRCFA